MQAGPECPWQLEYLWAAFCELSMGLKSDGMGPVMASWVDVESYAAATQQPLDVWEKVALIRIATLRASIQSEKQAADMKARQQK